QQAAKLAPGVQPGQSKMIAMHRETGKTVWETPLQATNVCYGIPAVHRAADGTTQIIAANTGNGMFGLNAADGTMMWSVPAFDKRCVSCPLIVQTRGNTLVLATTGSGGGGNRLAAVRPGVSGRDAELVYEINKSVGYVPTSAVLYSPTDRAPLLFMISDRGIATCSNALTGQNVWTRRIGGDFGASPIIIGDKLLLVSLSGQAHVLRAADKFESLGEFDLGGKSGASPAVAGGQLVLRIADKLCCLDIGE
ncbi:MAG: PQQ-binding-like beta-propeller repeat protein, partial [Planctomycetota bacterium]